MKKFLALLMAVVMIAALCACGAQQTGAAATAAPTAAPESNVKLQILCEQDDSMLNTYSLLAVNPKAPFKDADGKAVSGVAINTAGAAALINWLLSADTEKLAAGYGQDKYGQQLFYLLDKAPVSTAAIPAPTDATKTIRLSTTTSVNDSGLLDYLLPQFEEKYGYKVEVAAAGTGKAIANAECGNADLILVHAKTQEEAFVTGGYSYVLDGFKSERLSFLYNYFVLCGPANDPAGVKKAASVKDAFKLIADGKYPFVSRGDKSGTHTKEVTLWPAELGITTDADSVANYTAWYIYSNAGMGACLTMANEKGAYILSDKATFLTFVANNGAVTS